MEYKTCCLTGHRPRGFPWNYHDTGCDEHQEYLYTLLQKIKTLIEKYGCTHFISGLAIGADTDFVTLCLDLRDKQYPNITVEGAIPCPNQDAKWTTSDRRKYQELLMRLDKVTQVSDHYTAACFQKRNEYMIDHSDIVIAVWNGEQKGGTFNSIRYAKKTNKQISFIYLNE